ncbi:MAG: phytoene/squalene synthase family protein [Candidatus Bipolaricaulia bacterium]
MDDRLRSAYRRCRAETRRAARNFYWAFITLPRGRREAIYAVYSLFRRWDDIADSASSPVEKRRALEEQREIIRMLYHEDLHTCTLAHLDDDPVLLAVSDVIGRYQIPRRYFEDVLAGIELDLHKRRYRTFEELREYCYGVASAVGLISLEIFGYRDPVAREYAIDLGIAMQLTNILRDIKEDLERDRVYLPLEELERFGYSKEELQKQVVNDNFRELMRGQVARAREYFAWGHRLLRYLPLRSRPCPAVLAGLYRHILDKIEARGYDVFNDRISLTSREKLATLLWAPLEGLL